MQIICHFPSELVLTELVGGDLFLSILGFGSGSGCCVCSSYVDMLCTFQGHSESPDSLFVVAVKTGSSSQLHSCLLPLALLSFTMKSRRACPRFSIVSMPTETIHSLSIYLCASLNRISTAKEEWLTPIRHLVQEHPSGGVLIWLDLLLSQIETCLYFFPV